MEPPEDETIGRVVAEALQAHRRTPGPLLVILHAIQDALGCIPDGAVRRVAEGLNLSRAEVHGVVSFYPHFRRTPPGRHTIALCRAEACQSMQGRALEAHAIARLGVGFHGTSADGRFTLEPVYCLGNCALAPSMLVDGDLIGRVTPERFDACLAGRSTGR